MLKNPIRHLVAVLGLALVSLSAHAGTMSLSSPVNGTTVTAPIHITAKASSSYSIKGYKIYLDGSSAYS